MVDVIELKALDSADCLENGNCKAMVGPDINLRFARRGGLAIFETNFRIAK
jgi:hypothetical protein